MTIPTPPTMGVELPPLPEERLKRLDFQAHRDTDCKTGSWAHLLTFARLIEADHRAAIAADRQSASRATPEGCVLVPRELTEEMLVSACKAGHWHITKYSIRDVRAAYAAMIAAAPALTANQAAEAPPVAVEATKAVEIIGKLSKLPIYRHNEIDGEESDGTPRYWRERPFVSLRQAERIIREALNKEPK